MTLSPTSSTLSQNSTSNRGLSPGTIGGIAGGVVGGLLAVILILGLCLIRWRKPVDANEPRDAAPGEIIVRSNNETEGPAEVVGGRTMGTDDQTPSAMLKKDVVSDLSGRLKQDSIVA